MCNSSSTRSKTVQEPGSELPDGLPILDLLVQISRRTGAGHRQYTAGTPAFRWSGKRGIIQGKHCTELHSQDINHNLTFLQHLSGSFWPRFTAAICLIRVSAFLLHLQYRQLVPLEIIPKFIIMWRSNYSVVSVWDKAQGMHTSSRKSMGNLAEQNKFSEVVSVHREGNQSLPAQQGWWPHVLTWKEHLQDGQDTVRSC